MFSVTKFACIFAIATLCWLTVFSIGSEKHAYMVQFKNLRDCTLRMLVVFGISVSVHILSVFCHW